MPRRTQVVDSTSFRPLVEAALAAYSEDPSYAIQMARQAQTILNKRRVWALRLELRAAESAARSACESSTTPFTCGVASPCGTGVCPFAPASLFALNGLPAAPGVSSRPRASTFPTYSVEQAVRPLLEIRAQLRTSA